MVKKVDFTYVDERREIPKEKFMDFEDWMNEEILSGGGRSWGEE